LGTVGEAAGASRQGCIIGTQIQVGFHKTIAVRNLAVTGLWKSDARVISGIYAPFKIERLRKGGHDITWK
jgi:hypothetical protein